ncbi:MAG: TetR/AcrR family transcriptional regulator [Paludibacteraceae bacterium]|nr:TetR/AcrR family transcriptional regulator [Paludibacteraceae bacterium]
MELHDDTEQRIFNAAQRLFLQKGLSETTMQDIADLAGISRTSLHYYFRSKDRLFEKSLNNLIRNIMPRIDSTLAKDISLRDKIVEIATSYIEQLRGNELLPGFLIMELRRDPQEIIRFVFSEWTSIDFQSIKNQMDREVEAGLIRRFDISQMVVTIMGLCTFPFICEPILSDVFKALGGHQTFDNFITERKNIVNQMLSLWLTPSDK